MKTNKTTKILNLTISENCCATECNMYGVIPRENDAHLFFLARLEI